MGRWLRVAALGVTCALAGGGSLAGQLSLSLDGGAARVRYDGFLPSFAASLTPAVGFERGAATLVARGTLLRFESGHRSWQGLVAASVLTPRVGNLRGELGASLAGSRYLSFPRYDHVLVAPRVHWTAARFGGWLGGGLGRTVFGPSSRGVQALTAGAWLERSVATLTLTATASRVGDTSYTDIEARARAFRHWAEFDGWLGARVRSRGGGRGVYGEVTAIVPVSSRPRLAVVLSGGRYPSDPTRGSIPGRYVGMAIRVTGIPFVHPSSPSSATVDPPLPYTPHSSGTLLSPGEAILELRAAGGLQRRFRLYAPGAELVELTGDFTDWLPLRLRPVGAGVWEATIPVATGVHRVNVRVDGGPWRAPHGTTRVADDFGGEVGVLVVAGG